MFVCKSNKKPTKSRVSSQMEAGADLSLNKEPHVERGQEQAPEANAPSSVQGEVREQRKDATGHKIMATAGQDCLDQ